MDMALPCVGPTMPAYSPWSGAAGVLRFAVATHPLGCGEECCAHLPLGAHRVAGGWSGCGTLYMRGTPGSPAASRSVGACRRGFCLDHADLPIKREAIPFAQVSLSRRMAVCCLSRGIDRRNGFAVNRGNPLPAARPELSEISNRTMCGPQVRSGLSPSNWDAGAGFDPASSEA